MFEPPQRIPQPAVGRGALSQRRAQRSLALPGDLEQIVIAKPEQRALQRHRQRQIVLRQQQRIREVHQVDDRDMLGQLEAVGAGDRNAGVLQRLDHGIERIAAPAYQYQHVAIAQRPAVALAAGHDAAVDQRLDLGLNAPGKLHLGAGRGDAVERRPPAFDVLPVVGFREFPEIDLARAGVGQRVMDRISDVDRMNAAKDILLAKHLIDRMQDRRSRPERIGKGYRIELQSGALELPLQCPAAQVELAWRGALKRKDRLLLVPDREHRSHHAVARAGARGEFGNDVRDDVPLPRAGVLRFVDQHMIDAAVELVVNPARGDAVEHFQRLVDQIVIVEQAALLLLAAVVGRRRGSDIKKRLGAVAGHQGAAAFDQGKNSPGFRFDQLAYGRIVVREFLRHHRFAGRAIGFREEYAEILVDLRSAGEHQRTAQPRGLVLIGLVSGFQNQGDVLPSRSRQVGSVDDVTFDILDPIVGIYAKRRRNLRGGGMRAAGGICPCHKVIAAEAGLAHDVLEGDVGGARHRRHQRAARRAIGIARRLEENPEIGALHHLVLVAVVEHGKPRRHIGLERELLQQPRAQRVDGLHLQPARRLQRAGKQFARRFAQARAGIGNAGITDRRIQRVVIERHPMAQRGEHPFRHVGGGSFCKRDAEDLFRRHVGEQQPDHPLHQHMGLARACVGRNEGGSRRIGGTRLGGANGVGNDAGSLHHSSIPNPPAADHSLIRARSS